MDLNLGNGRVLNPMLVERQGLGEVQVAELKVLHEIKDRIFDVANATPDAIPHLRVALMEIEFAMQAAWGFDKDPTKHTWQFLMPRGRANG